MNKVSEANRRSRLYHGLAEQYMDTALDGAPIEALDLQEHVVAVFEQVRGRRRLARPRAELLERLQQRLLPDGERVFGDEYERTLAINLAAQIDSELFDCGMNFSPPAPRRNFSVQEMRERTRLLMQFTVEAGTLADLPAAARWLANAISSELTNLFSAGPPPCSHETAIGFLQALHEEGATVEIDPDDRLDVFPKDGLTSPHEVVCWCTAIDVFNTAKSMEKVYSNHELKARESAPAPARQRPTRTRRVL